jgi:hypothetical protein
MYTIENGIVYDNHVTPSGSAGIVAIGNEEQYSTMETASQTVYQWQKFNLDTGSYENDTTNITLILEQTPINGQVSIDKTDEVKASVLEQIATLYNATILAGFTSNGSTFKYDMPSQIDFVKLDAAITKGIIPFPVSIPNANQVNVAFTQEQYTQFLNDMTIFDLKEQTQLDTLCNEVKACTTVDEVNAITISFN